MMEEQVISKKRVAEYGEVLTGLREVNAMLDLVKRESDRIESRFLEPACGTGNFLVEILRRKLRVVEKRYSKNQLEYERNAVLAVSSIYGIDILKDNVCRCRQRLFDIFATGYHRLFEHQSSERCCKSILYILKCNIVHGDALTLKTIGKHPCNIVFSEWSPVNGSYLKRREFTFRSLLEHESMKGLPIFSDLGDNVFIPTPEKEYPLTHFLEIAYAEKH